MSYENNEITEILARLSGLEVALAGPLARLEALAALLEALAGGNAPARARADTGKAVVLKSDDLHKQRVAELERLFWKLVNDHRLKRVSSYHQPKRLVEHPMKPFRQLITLSVLVNQASLRKVFKRQCPADFDDCASPADVVRKVLDDTNLLVVPINKLDVQIDSVTQVVISPGEALRLAKEDSWVPRAFKGWTCKERAEAKRSPAGGWLEIPEDPCGERVWSDEGVGRFVDAAGALIEEGTHWRYRPDEIRRVGEAEAARLSKKAVAKVSVWEDEAVEEREVFCKNPAGAVEAAATTAYCKNEYAGRVAPLDAWALKAEEEEDEKDTASVVEEQDDETAQEEDDGTSQEEDDTEAIIARLAEATRSTVISTEGSVLDAMEREWETTGEVSAVGGDSRGPVAGGGAPQNHGGSYRQRVQFVEDE